MNKALIRYLENRFVEIARNSNRYLVLTKNTYRSTVLKESQIAIMEEFIDNVKVLINALGYKVLEPFDMANSPSTKTDDEILHLSTGSAKASGKVTTEGFVVFAGATVNDKSSKSLSSGMQKLRQRIFDSGKVEDFTTKEDILFSSSSAAADFILGYSVSGPQTWKSKDGRTLKEIETRWIN